MTALVEQRWFEFYDESIQVDPSNDADCAFLAGLRARAVSHRWSCDPDVTFAYHELDGDQHLLRVGVWLHDWEMRCGLLTFVAEFDGSRVLGDEGYSEIPFDLLGPSEVTMEFAGSLAALVEQVGEWFEWLLTWPIERREWFKNGELVHREWVLPDTGRRLAAHGRSKPCRRPDVVTLVRGVPAPQQAGPRWWSFFTRHRK